MIWNYTHSEELYHHGIKGMKWGVRRYQNRDGSLTRAGKYRARQVREHAGPGKYYGSTERQIAKNKKDLEYLDKGGHLSIGNNKKRQEEYDQRDRRLINERIGKLEDKQAKKQAKKEHRIEVKKEKQQKKADALERRARIAETAARMNVYASGRERFKYSDATRKTAAKYVVDNNMSVDDAKKKAYKEARVVAAAMLAIHGAEAVYELKKAGDI